MKVAKVLAFYFGNRRLYPHNKEGVIQLLKRQIESHKKIQPGVPTDLILVNHDTGDVEVRELLSQYEGMEINGGVVRILHRPRISFDLSMGSFKYAFYVLQNEYDYWFFCEDDVETIKDNVVIDMITLLNSDSRIGFVAACDYRNYNIHHYITEDGFIRGTGVDAPHAHGGIGLTSTKIIRDVSQKISSYLSTPNIDSYINGVNSTTLLTESYENENTHEINFTNDFIKAGYELKSFSDGTNFLHIRENITL
jgi:hypothetical protein